MIAGNKNHVVVARSILIYVVATSINLPQHFLPPCCWEASSINHIPHTWYYIYLQHVLVVLARAINPTSLLTLINKSTTAPPSFLHNHPIGIDFILAQHLLFKSRQVRYLHSLSFHFLSYNWHLSINHLFCWHIHYHQLGVALSSHWFSTFNYYHGRVVHRGYGNGFEFSQQPRGARPTTATTTTAAAASAAATSTTRN